MGDKKRRLARTLTIVSTRVPQRLAFYQARQDKFRAGRLRSRSEGVCSHLPRAKTLASSARIYHAVEHADSYKRWAVRNGIFEPKRRLVPWQVARDQHGGPELLLEEKVFEARLQPPRYVSMGQRDGQGCKSHLGRVEACEDYLARCARVVQVDGNRVNEHLSMRT